MTKRLGWAIALAAFILGSALALRYAESAGLLGAEGARRTLQVLFGLMLAGYANLMPKQPGPLRGSLRAEAAARAALRVGGWSLSLAGVIYACLWAFAPLEIADTAGLVVVATATALTFGYAGWVYTTCRRGRGASASR